MILDTVVSTVLNDTESRVTISVTGVSNGVLTTTNSKILTANSVKFANTSQVCILDLVGFQFSTSIAAGWLALEWINAAGNSTITVVGRTTSGSLAGYYRNPNTAVAGDLNLNLHGLAAGDSFSLVIDLVKNDFNGAYSNLANPWNAITSNLY